MLNNTDFLEQINNSLIGNIVYNNNIFPFSVIPIHRVYPIQSKKYKINVYI